jgi:hypothetical protein
MGLTFSRFYTSLSSLAFWGKDKEVRILMVGLDSAGKVSWKGAVRQTSAGRYGLAVMPSPLCMTAPDTELWG